VEICKKFSRKCGVFFIIWRFPFPDDLLDKSGAPLKMFDIVVAFIEKHNGRTFPQNGILKCQDALLNVLRKLFPTPEAEVIPVAMETGNEELSLGTWSWSRGGPLPSPAGLPA
jgi:hypothetical protein